MGTELIMASNVEVSPRSNSDTRSGSSRSIARTRPLDISLYREIKSRGVVMRKPKPNLLNVFVQHPGRKLPTELLLSP